MSFFGTQFAYRIQSNNEAQLGKEIGFVGDTYQNCGWSETAIIPSSGFPEYIVFTWQQEGRPIYPSTDPAQWMR